VLACLLSQVQLCKGAPTPFKHHALEHSNNPLLSDRARPRSPPSHSTYSITATTLFCRTAPAPGRPLHTPLTQAQQQPSSVGLVTIVNRVLVLEGATGGGRAPTEELRCRASV